MKNDLLEIETKLQTPEVWSNQKLASELGQQSKEFKQTLDMVKEWDSIIDDADVLHLDGNSLKTAIEASKYAKEKGVLVSLDAGGLYENIETLLPYVDILIPSEEFAMGITKTDNTKDAIIELNKRYNPKVLVVTEGSKGGIYYENGEVKSYSSLKVNCVDSNGAGDTFHGAFIAAYCEGKNVKDCCVFASKVAGYKCSQIGARTYPLTRALVDKL